MKQLQSKALDLHQLPYLYACMSSSGLAVLVCPEGDACTAAIQSLTAGACLRMSNSQNSRMPVENRSANG